MAAGSKWIITRPSAELAFHLLCRSRMGRDESHCAVSRPLAPRFQGARSAATPGRTGQRLYATATQRRASIANPGHGAVEPAVVLLTGPYEPGSLIQPGRVYPSPVLRQLIPRCERPPAHRRL